MDNTVEVQVQELGKVMVTNRGEYISSKSYEILDIVSYNGSSFMSKIDDNTSVPAEEISPDELLINENWQLVAKKGDTYKVTEEDLQAIAKQITDNANSAFNQNVKTKTKEFNTNATNKLNDYDTNSKSTTETFDANAKKKLDEYNANDTKKLKAYNDNADNKLSAYNANDTNKLKAYNTNADFKIEEYNTNANSKILEYDKHSEELRNMAISTDNDLERVKNEILDTGSASDSFVHVEDSCMAKIKELEIEGVINQKITTGKNLLDYVSNLLTSSNGLTNVINEDGSITTSGQPTLAYTPIVNRTTITDILEDGQIYTISQRDTNNKIYLQIEAAGKDGTLSRFTTTSGKSSFTVNKSTYEKYSLIIQTGSIETWGNSTLTITNKYMLCKGIDTADTSFEPYTGGQPSPSPDYPQEIKTITDNLKIISCGRNLFDIDKFRKSITGQGITSVIDGTSIICNGTAITTYATILVPLAKNIKFYPGQYTMSMTNSLPYNIAIQTERLNGSRGKDLVLNSGKTSQIINITEILIVNSVFLSFQTARPNLTNFTISDIQIEQANTASEYEPYVESLITANLPEGEFIGKINDTYKDTLRTEYFPKEGKYHLMLDKMVGKHTLTGNENWATYTQSNGIPIFRCTLPVNGIVVKSNYFVSQTTWATLLEENRIFNHVGNYQNIEIACSKFDTLTNFKNFLTTNVVQMYHALKMPYTLDLVTINMPLSYKKITNIFTDSDLLPTINAKYYRTFQTTIQNLQINEKSLKQEITDLNNNISDITKRLEALESANVNTVEESEASNDLQN